MPSSAKRSTRAASTTASRSASRASNEKSVTSQSERPKPRSSYRTQDETSPSRRTKCFQTGLCRSYSRWLSQQVETTSGGPSSPSRAYAIRVPSADRAKATDWAGGWVEGATPMTVAGATATGQGIGARPLWISRRHAGPEAARRLKSRWW